MTITIPDIRELPVSAKAIGDAAICIKYLPAVVTKPKSKEDAEHVVQHIVAIIKCETQSEAAQGVGERGEQPPSINQVVLNVAFRCYYQQLREHKLEDKHFGQLWKEQLTHTSSCGFQVLYAMLLADQCGERLDAAVLVELCLEAFTQAVEQDGDNLLAILKALNLLCKKHDSLEINVPLERIYHCLQSGQCGMREETLTLFAHCCKQSEVAFEHFKVVLEFWPWTNRNKLYLLSCILNAYSLQALLEAAQYSPKEFYGGVRLALSYKSLLAASQYLVKALSSQNCPLLLELSAELLTRGTLKEIQNFYSQWYARIVQKDALFELLQAQPEVARFLADTIRCADSTENYRLVLIFSMFSRQIFAASKLHFFKISTELITNCFHFEVDAQLLIFKFIVDNFASFAIEDCLEFIVAFVQQHRSVESAQYRNSVLGKMPTIINYVAKTFGKLQIKGGDTGGTTLEASIKTFFLQLQQLIDADVCSAVYQPKIFALQLLEMLLKSLYAEQLTKNAKNCSIAHNEHLGIFLIEQHVFNASQMAEKLLTLLNDPLGFDDALELIVTLLHRLKYADVAESIRLCREFTQRCDVDECVLSALYARVAMQCCKVAFADEQILELFNFASISLAESLPAFKQDPLAVCKQQHHLFGYINTMNEIMLVQPRLLASDFPMLLNLIENVLNMLLQFLNLANSADDGANVNTAASFQDMDESLEMLVQQSALSVEDHPESRKFLLMSFWLTLRACCDLATTIGCILVPRSVGCAGDLAMLGQCLRINVAALTRCRHKGAIEATGVSIGKFTRSITSQLPSSASGYKLLHDCLELLFDSAKQVSTTRRGAGFSIMLLHIVKNEASRGRSILKRTIANIMKRLKDARHQSNSTAADALNCDRMEALILHYLCVLVKDSELRDAMAKYHDEIVLAAIENIEHSDWTICNAALQLFGALLPKIVGQKQATEFEAPVAWDTAEVTYDEIAHKLPKTCAYILEYCASNAANSRVSTRSIILFLGFLSKVEHLRKGLELREHPLLERFRELMWRLLRHNCEKVRKLAALCFVRAHEFRCELPQVLLSLAKLLYSVQDENLFEGLVFALSEGVLKLQHESKHTTDCAASMQTLQDGLAQTDGFKRQQQFSSYTLSKLLDLYMLVGFDGRTLVVSELIKLHREADCMGHDVWLQSVAHISN